MTGLGFGTLALLVVAGLLGPLLAAVPRLRLPSVVGELLVGIILGKTGFGVIDHTEPTFELLANIGFALVMFVVGTHVPVRDREMWTAGPTAAVRAVLVGAVAAGLGVGLATFFGTGHAALYGVLMASSSAALALPIIDGLQLTGPPVLSVTAQIAIADTACIVLLPLVIDPSRAPRAALGAAAIAACAFALYLILRWANDRGFRKRLHHYSERRKLALELRFSLAMLFGLAALAVGTHVSIMLAASPWVWWSPRSVSPGGWPVNCSVSPRDSSGRCSSSGWAPRCRCAIWGRIRSSSPSVSRSAWAPSWPTRSAGSSSNPGRSRSCRRPNSAYPLRRRPWAPNNTSCCPANRRHSCSEQSSPSQRRRWRVRWRGSVSARRHRLTTEFEHPCRRLLLHFHLLRGREYCKFGPVHRICRTSGNKRRQNDSVGYMEPDAVGGGGTPAGDRGTDGAA